MFTSSNEFCSFPAGPTASAMVSSSSSAMSSVDGERRAEADFVEVRLTERGTFPSGDFRWLIDWLVDFGCCSRWLPNWSRRVSWRCCWLTDWLRELETAGWFDWLLDWRLNWEDVSFVFPGFAEETRTSSTLGLNSCMILTVNFAPFEAACSCSSVVLSNRCFIPGTSRTKKVTRNEYIRCW